MTELKQGVLTYVDCLDDTSREDVRIYSCQPKIRGASEVAIAVTTDHLNKKHTTMYSLFFDRTANQTLHRIDGDMRTEVAWRMGYKIEGDKPAASSNAARPETPRTSVDALVFA